MTDRERLARIFGVTLTQPAGPLVGAAALTFAAPIAGLFTVAATAGVLAAMRIADDKQLERGLSEVESWGFPVTGYRDWLLAAEPTFDLELARDISIEVIRGSIEAVDRTAVVEKPSERVVRVVTRLVKIGQIPFQPMAKANPPAPQTTEAEGGDRRLLLELRDRVLGPLHADCGIVAMRMGERSRLRALVATAKEGGDGAFRDQALTAPPALQQLAAGTMYTRPPNEASKRDHRWHRVLVAMGEPPGDGSAVAWVAGAGFFAACALGPLGFVAAAAGTVAAAKLTTSSRRARVQRIVDGVNRHGFPVEGFEDYVISGRPIFDVELARAVPRRIVEDLLGPNDFRLTWIDDTLLRIETPPRLVVVPDVFEPFWGGDARQFTGLIGSFLVPLHTRVGIVAVRMGGYVARRA